MSSFIIAVLGLLNVAGTIFATLAVLCFIFWACTRIRF